MRTFFSLLLLSLATGANAAPVTGAIFTTEATCTGTNINIFENKASVYLNGGPANPRAAGLPNGGYYVRVTEPDGDELGTSVGAAIEQPILVVNGKFQSCYRLEDILIKKSDGTPGYDTTTNPGGEYKVWVSTVASFTEADSKTDNFKVKAQPVVAEPTTLTMIKFYDANANGINDDGQLIAGWQVDVQHADHEYVDQGRQTPITLTLDPNVYLVSEQPAVEPNWMVTAGPIVTVELPEGMNTTIAFGNLCLGAGGGHTLGYWSNKNAQSFATSRLAALTALNLRTANGGEFNPTNYASYRSWILSATATNMTYMLSAQMAAMQLSVWSGFVDGNALIYAPGTASANALGFASVNAVLAEANSALTVGIVMSGSPLRGYYEAIKNALDRGNNNLNFVQPTACAFTFAQ